MGEDLDLDTFHDYCCDQRLLWSEVQQDLALHGRKKVHVLCYDDLVSDTEAAVSAVCDFVGLNPAATTN